jgi:glycosyltransferase involved in cell wall biosynthesis
MEGPIRAEPRRCAQTCALLKGGLEREVELLPLSLHRRTSVGRQVARADSRPAWPACSVVLLPSSPMRAPVLHVIQFLWSGAGGVLTRLCEAQRRNGPVAIVTTGRHGDQPDWPAYRARLRRAGVTHHTIDFFHREDGRFWSRVAELTDLVRDLRPAVIHAHAGVPACAAVIARAISGHRARVIGQMYSWGPNRPEWMNQQDMWGFSQADRVIASAHAYSDLLVRYGVPARKLVYLPWGLPLEDLPLRNGTPRRATTPTIGFVGRIEPRKGQLELVDAFVRVRKACPAARLDLVGPVADDQYAARVHATIEKHDLRDVVTVTGDVRDVRPYLRRWDLFVSLSSDEGQGLAVLEAMAIGVPVAARRVAGISDFLVHGRTGFAIDRTSAAGVADAIVSALSSPSRLRTVAQEARRVVERKYSWARTLKAFERLYCH